MKRRLIFLDIDGTLTPPGSNVPPASALRAIREARARGHKVFFCTGRNRAMLAPLLACGFDGAVASAGGYVFCGKKVLFDCPMSEGQRDRALRLFGEQGVFRTLETRDAAFGDRGMAEFLGRVSGGNSELVRWRRALERDLNIRPMEEYDGQPVYKIVFLCERAEQLLPARGELEGEFRFAVQEEAGSPCLNGEIINRRFDKGDGVRRIAAAFGAELADTVGFGDSENDREMLLTVGTSVCMGNGSPSLQALSGLVCPSVGDDGLAWAFRELGLTQNE